jgi:hypothetical protein
MRLDTMKRHKGHTLRITPLVQYNARGKFKGYSLFCIDCQMNVDQALEDEPIKDIEERLAEAEGRA